MKKVKICLNIIQQLKEDSVIEFQTIKDKAKVFVVI